MFGNTVCILEKNLSRENLITVGTGFLINCNSDNTYVITTKHMITKENPGYINISLATDDEPQLVYKIPLKNDNENNLTNHETSDICSIRIDKNIVPIIEKHKKTQVILDEKILCNKWEYGEIIDSYSIGFSAGSLNPIIRQGPTFIPFIKKEPEWIASMMDFPGDSGSPVYETKNNTIIGMRSAKDGTKGIAWIVPAYRIKEVLKQP